MYPKFFYPSWFPWNRGYFNVSTPVSPRKKFGKQQQQQQQKHAVHKKINIFLGQFFGGHLEHSHKKRKDSLEGSLDRVLLAAEFEFPKILVPRLPQHTSDVNNECAGKSEWSKQQCSLHVTSFLEHWYILILLFWY